MAFEPDLLRFLVSPIEQSLERDGCLKASAMLPYDQGGWYFYLRVGAATYFEFSLEGELAIDGNLSEYGGAVSLNLAIIKSESEAYAYGEKLSSHKIHVGIATDSQNYPNLWFLSKVRAVHLATDRVSDFLFSDKAKELFGAETSAKLAVSINRTFNLTKSFVDPSLRALSMRTKDARAFLRWLEGLGGH